MSEDIFSKTIAGKYVHFKGNTYNVFCLAKDLEDQLFVIYKQCYGDKSFWVRPYKMFFEKVELNGKIVDRFTPTNGVRKKSNGKIKTLINLVENQELAMRNSETLEEYFIVNVNEEWNYVVICAKNKQGAGYLTEYELLGRMGYSGCVINGEMRVFNKQTPVSEVAKLKIGNNDISLLLKQLNPCSIDLQIAQSGYLITKKKIVDPQSIELISRANTLWKKVKVYKSKRQNTTFFKIRPGETILTHTKEKLKIPYDCAGKIEIKSTYARLSLSISSGDFCNPGYEGYFPFEITNKGNHTIILHQCETMAQLMLIQMNGPIFVNYKEKATYRNDQGYDDGTPYSFWRERSINQLRNERGTQEIVNVYYGILNSINSDNTKDINAFRQRLNNNFLPFCQKKLNKNKYRNQDNELPDNKKIIYDYIKREKFLKSISKIKWISIVLTLLSSLIPLFFQYWETDLATKLWVCLGIIITLLTITILLWLKFPKYFCTFEYVDIEKIWEVSHK